MLRTAGFGFAILTAITCTLVRTVCFAFVDDTDILHAASNPQTTGEEILYEFQDAVDMWEGGLRATGGKIRADKSFWYMIDFKWINGKWQYKSINDLPGDITIRDASGRTVFLTRLEPYEARETMGVWMAMDGNKKLQVEKMRDSAMEFAECIRTGFVDPHEAWIALNTTIMKTLEYPMEVMSLSESQWKYIMKPILKRALPKAGFVRTFPHDLLYAPRELSGLGLKNPYLWQYIKQITLYIRETTSPGSANELLLALVKQFRLEAGVKVHDGNWQIEKTSLYATDCWLKELLHFCADHDIRLCDTFPQLPTWTTNDKYLMDGMVKGKYTANELYMINSCRMFLQVTMLSDIATADLKRVDTWALQGIKNTFRPSPMKN